MYIGAPEVRSVGPDVEYSVPYRLADGRQHDLRYRLPAEFEPMVSPRADAALVALLIPSMQQGGDLHVEGPVTDELVHRLHHGYQDVLREIMPGLRPVRVVADHQLPVDTGASGVATGFSAGVDSFNVLVDHFYATDVPPSLRLTHLLFNHTGSHQDAGSGDRALFLDRYRRAARVADKIGLPIIPVDTNVMDPYLRQGLDYQQTHTARNASVAFLLQRGLRTWYYASAFRYPDVHARRHFEMSFSDPIALPLLSTSSLQLESNGGQCGRFEKTMRIAEIPDTYWSLDVCVVGQTGGNCSACYKCLRTQATLEIGGFLERYDQVFDQEVYRRHREEYLTFIRLSRDPVVQEMVREAKRRRFELPRITVRRISPTLLRHAGGEVRRHQERLMAALGI